MATKKSKKIYRRQKQLGEIVSKDSSRKAGGLIYTVRALRERDQRLGKFGAASPCRRIDPANGEVIEEIAAKENTKAKVERSNKRKTWAKRGSGGLRFGSMADAAERIVERNNSLHPLLKTIR